MYKNVQHIQGHVQRRLVLFSPTPHLGMTFLQEEHELAIREAWKPLGRV